MIGNQGGKVTLTPGFKKMLESRFEERVRFDAPMSDYTSFGVGGPADALVAPADTSELIDLLRALEQEGIDWFVLGGGTNLLVTDAGIRGVVLSLREGFGGIVTQKKDADHQEQVLVHAGAGARLSALCRYAVAHNLRGMNFAVGIPGTVGGAIIMNAGTAEGAIDSVLSAIDVLHVPDQPGIISRDELLFTYRGLEFKPSMRGQSGHEPIVLAGRFSLKPEYGRRLAAEAEALLAERRKNQPAGLSAGCVFKNPSAQMPAGRLIDRAGLKGQRIGDALVSEVHANFIINCNKAGADDILRLMEIIREKVYLECGVELKPEIKIVGE